MKSPSGWFAAVPGFSKPRKILLAGMTGGALLLGAGPASADLLAAWKRMNSSTDAIASGKPAHTNHPKLGEVKAYWKTNFYKYNDNSWFYVEPFYTGSIVNGVCATNYTTGNKKPVTNFISFVFSVSNGYKIKFTNFMTRLSSYPTTNFFRSYTAYINYRTSKLPQTEVRYYGHRARSAWVYQYWTNRQAGWVQPTDPWAGCGFSRGWCSLSWT